MSMSHPPTATFNSPSNIQQPKLRAPGPRRKACQQCFSIKLRCDHQRPTCSRCLKRKLDCVYSAPAEAGESVVSQTVASEKSILGNSTVLEGLSEYVGNDLGDISHEEGSTNGHIYETPSRYGRTPEENVHEPTFSSAEQPDFSNISLICSIDIEKVRTRWLEGFAPSPDRRVKTLSLGMTFFILTGLRSYPCMLTRPNTLPPFIHAKQLHNGQLPPQLARCVNVAHMWANQVPGSEDMVRDFIHKEMRDLHHWLISQPSINDSSHLLALQTYLLYCLMLLPTSPNDPITLPQDFKINLQEMASESAQQGLLCPAEQSQSRPDWPSWIIAEAKRRTLFTIYMFDDVVNTINNLPCILGDELSSLPMTCSKTLWSATSKVIWEREYNALLGLGKQLRLSELWTPPVDTEARKRKERWLASVDEYGMMIYSIASITALG